MCRVSWPRIWPETHNHLPIKICLFNNNEVSANGGHLCKGKTDEYCPTILNFSDNTMWQK